MHLHIQPKTIGKFTVGLVKLFFSVMFCTCQNSDILPFCISCPAIFPEQIALCFHLFGSYAAIHVKETNNQDSLL